MVARASPICKSQPRYATKLTEIACCQGDVIGECNRCDQKIVGPDRGSRRLELGSDQTVMNRGVIVEIERRKRIKKRAQSSEIGSSAALGDETFHAGHQVFDRALDVQRRAVDCKGVLSTFDRHQSPEAVLVVGDFVGQDGE